MATQQTARLPVPAPKRAGALAFVDQHLHGLYSGPLAGSGRYGGGQTRADAALHSLDLTNYASNRNEVWPEPRRGATGLSPYIRHGLLQLPRVWDRAATAGSGRDLSKFRDELLWQEFARHWYSRLGQATAENTRHSLPETHDGAGSWSRSMACIEVCLDELEEEGWLVNQSRMWLASHWVIRERGRWQNGEDEFFRHLLDGSRAANRLGWQWVTGAGSSKAYGFSRWQVEKRAPGLCGQCELSANCPIEQWPDDPTLVKLEPNPKLRRAVDPTDDAGPNRCPPVGQASRADLVWLTGESLGDDDPALVANPDLPAVFVFDDKLLARLQLSAKRLVFLVESLSDLSTRREVQVFRGSPPQVLKDRRVAATFAPVPGFRRISRQINLTQTHPYPWLKLPTGGSVSSFSMWRKSVGE